jgi:hypothetical protein
VAKDDNTNAMTGLRTFRERLYSAFGRQADALFELTDSILTVGRVPSPCT